MRIPLLVDIGEHRLRVDNYTVEIYKCHTHVPKPCMEVYKYGEFIQQSEDKYVLHEPWGCKIAGSMVNEHGKFLKTFMVVKVETKGLNPAIGKERYGKLRR